MDLIDLVPIPASHIKKVVQKYDSDGDKSDDNDNMAQNEPKKRQNMNDNVNTTAMGESMETMIDNTDIRMSGSHLTQIPLDLILSLVQIQIRTQHRLKLMMIVEMKGMTQM